MRHKYKISCQTFKQHEKLVLIKSFNCYRLLCAFYLQIPLQFYKSDPKTNSNLQKVDTQFEFRFLWNKDIEHLIIHMGCTLDSKIIAPNTFPQFLCIVQSQLAQLTQMSPNKHKLANITH